MSVATGTIDPTIVDGLIALPDKPAAAAQPGASGQWQMLQPAGQPPASPEAQTKSVSASNDSWIGAFLQNRLPRSSSLTRGGGLSPADSPAGAVQEGPRLSSQRGLVPPSTQRTPGSLSQGATGTEGPSPSHGPAATARAHTPSLARTLVEQLGNPGPSPASPSGQARACCPWFHRHKP